MYSLSSGIICILWRRVQLQRRGPVALYSLSHQYFTNSRKILVMLCQEEEGSLNFPLRMGGTGAHAASAAGGEERWSGQHRARQEDIILDTPSPSEMPPRCLARHSASPQPCLLYSTWFPALCSLAWFPKEMRFMRLYSLCPCVCISIYLSLSFSSPPWEIVQLQLTLRDK